ncbi:putative Myosin light chain kinase A [Blattamonas nauphoetae]|uniref:Myosin light chain kinase A n=1 Tax=Blattamonas nauphoetae TaxID=2049346 RepID=A0ABQ9Y1H7_9EUKA|nr:putative Myosin light chain kinase A [Blattamonas nauphoetae]
MIPDATLLENSGCVSNGNISAAKIIDDQGVAQKEFSIATLLAQLCEKHRYLTITYNALRCPTTEQLVLFMDYADRGNVSDIIKATQSHGAPETLVKKIVFMIAHGLTQLHINNFIHRDIKPDNILLAYDPKTLTVRTLISDYGLLRQVGDSNQSLGEVSMTSPEALDEEPYDQSLDIWSLGCITYELLQGTHPFLSTGYMSLRRKVDEPPPPITTQQLSKECQDFLSQTIQKDKNLRLSASKGTLLSHPWLSNLNDQNTELTWDEYVSLSSPNTIPQDVDVERTQNLPKNMISGNRSHIQDQQADDPIFLSQQNIYSANIPPNISLIHTQLAPNTSTLINPTGNLSSGPPFNYQQQLYQSGYSQQNPSSQPFQTGQQGEQLPIGGFVQNETQTQNQPQMHQNQFAQQMSPSQQFSTGQQGEQLPIGGFVQNETQTQNQPQMHQNQFAQQMSPSQQFSTGQQGEQLPIGGFPPNETQTQNQPQMHQNQFAQQMSPSQQFSTGQQAEQLPIGGFVQNETQTQNQPQMHQNQFAQQMSPSQQFSTGQQGEQLPIGGFPPNETQTQNQPQMHQNQFAQQMSPSQQFSTGQQAEQLPIGGFVQNETQTQNQPQMHQNQFAQQMSPSQQFSTGQQAEQLPIGGFVQNETQTQNQPQMHQNQFAQQMSPSQQFSTGQQAEQLPIGGFPPNETQTQNQPLIPNQHPLAFSYPQSTPQVFGNPPPTVEEHQLTVSPTQPFVQQMQQPISQQYGQNFSIYAQDVGNHQTYHPLTQTTQQFCSNLPNQQFDQVCHPSTHNDRNDTPIVSDVEYSTGQRADDQLPQINQQSTSPDHTPPSSPHQIPVPIAHRTPSPPKEDEQGGTSNPQQTRNGPRNWRKIPSKAGRTSPISLGTSPSYQQNLSQNGDYLQIYAPQTQITPQSHLDSPSQQLSHPPTSPSKDSASGVGGQPRVPSPSLMVQTGKFKRERKPEEAMVCEFCGLSFPSSKFEQHRSTCSAKAEEEKRKEQEAQNAEVQKKNEAWANEDVSCTFCQSRVLRKRSTMPAHLLGDCPMHRLTKPIICPICWSEIATVDALTTHLVNAHSDVLEAARDNGVRCGGCGKHMPFDDFLPHVAGCASREIRRYFLCPICFKFCSKDSVLSHVKEAHYQEFRPFEPVKCQFCIQKVKRNGMAAHLLNSCSFTYLHASFPCNFCQAIVPYNDFPTHYQNAHRNEFVTAVESTGFVKCVKCTGFVHRSEFAKHVLDVCRGRQEQHPSVCPLCFKLLVDEKIRDHVKSVHRKQLGLKERVVEFLFAFD